MSLPSVKDAPWFKAPATQAVFAALNKDGAETRIVGGAVRNGLMGLNVAEVDFASTAEPEQVVKLAEAAGLKAVPTGLEHGTVTVVTDGVGHEVTTLREDVETDGRHATVRFTTDWAADASRRDFTLNALYADADGTVHDPLGGYEDLEAGRIRFIGDPAARIAEDYLRILRFFRFFAIYGKGTIDADGLSACVRLRDGLDGLSAERVWGEMKRLLVAPRAKEVVGLLYDYGLLPQILGSAPRLPQFDRLAEIEAVVGAAPNAALRLAALAVYVEDDLERLTERFRLSNAESAVLEEVVDVLQIEKAPDEATGKHLLYRLGPDSYRRRVLTTWMEEGAAPDDDAWTAAYELPDRWQAPEFPLKGEDVMAMGVPSGPQVGRILRVVERTWIEAGFEGEREVLLKQAEAASKA
ncbi:CCA tRNA nucleotidyltransferase [Methyloligella solikamskensis]|uniref:CCA tRNA nucleotidyltransferase n=1 Tax=Methyloligella solikamskensis TaxID=1177756 RepID=A0ABW3JA70_9HYPH